MSDLHVTLLETINKPNDNQTAAFEYMGDRFDISFMDNAIMIEMLEIDKSIVIIKEEGGYAVGVGNPDESPTWVHLKGA